MLINTLHRVWINENPSIPFEIYRKQWIDSWNEYHPEWRFVLWDTSSSRALIRDHYGWFLSIYDDYPNDILRADAVRYFIMHRFGGLYVDLDFECFRPVDGLFDGQDVCLVSKNPDCGHRPWPKLRNLINGLMYSTPGHPFWKHVVLGLIASAGEDSVVSSTGPLLLTRCYLSYAKRCANEITLLAPRLFLPYLSDTSARNMGLDTRVAELNEKGASYFPDAYGAHRWASNWSDFERG